MNKPYVLFCSRCGHLSKLGNTSCTLTLTTNGTGATKLVSHDNIYQEIGWLPLAKRRYIHKLILFYKIINGLTPNYLLSIVPSRNPGPQPNTRTRDNLPMLLCKTTLYYNSFFPSCIRAWNNLQRDLKDEPSVELFRQIIFKHFSSTYVPVVYYSGSRNLQIMHTRLRTQCSALNSHLFNKNIINSPLCLCRSEETSKQFLLHCPRYENQRLKMLNSNFASS